MKSGTMYKSVSQCSKLLNSKVFIAGLNINNYQKIGVWHTIVNPCESTQEQNKNQISTKKHCTFPVEARMYAIYLETDERRQYISRVAHRAARPSR